MKNLFSVAALFAASSLFAQFNIHILSPKNFDADEAYIYELSGSRDILVAKISPSNFVWKYRIEKPYSGMMKIYFPKYNSTINFISENKNVDFALNFDGKKITSIDYLDEANKTMDAAQELLRKKEQILPALIQIQEFYKPESEFGIALKKEVLRLSSSDKVSAAATHLFISYYSENYAKYAQNSSTATKDEIVSFLAKSNDFLETSSLLRPILLNYVSNFGKEDIEKNIEDLLSAVNIETPRGQTVLAELIDIFDGYGLESLKKKYLTQAQNLKCTINDQLATTIQNNKNVEIGAVLPDYSFTSPLNTTARSVHGVKASKKVIFIWSSTCSHCEADIPVLLQNYQKLKAMGVEIIGLSVDSNRDEYLKKATALPWINDTELRGWYSTYANAYNVHATPTYFVLDSNNKIIAKPDHANNVLEFFKLK